MTSAVRRGDSASGYRETGRLLLVDAPADFVHLALDSGFEVWLVHDFRTSSALPAPGADQHAHVEFHGADFTDSEELRGLLTKLTHAHGIGWLLAFGRAATLSAVVETAEELGLSPSPADAARRIGDPVAMRALLNGSGHSYVGSAAVGTLAELPAAVARFSPPVIVKPLHAAAGDPKRSCPLREAGEFGLSTRRGMLSRHPGPFLVEEFLDGPLFGVETLTVHGMHRTLGITSLHRSGGPGGDALFPAPLPHREQTEMRAVCAELLGLAGYEFGPAHTVVALTADGPRVVRSQPRRPDGPAARLLELATGFAPESGLLQAISGSLPETPAAHRYASVVSFRCSPGRLVSVEGVAEIAALPWVHTVHFPYAPGAMVPGPGEHGSGKGHGHAVISAGSPEEEVRRADTVRSLLKTEVQRTG